jgi:hypothetical protein
MSNDIISTDGLKPARRMGIKNLSAGLVERGKIKIGNKGAVRQSQGGNSWQAPQKLDHFLITTTERGKDNNFLRDESLHEKLGDKPRDIPVVLIYDDIDLNFQTRYAAYAGKTLWCSGDGEQASRAQKLTDGSVQYNPVSCPCERQAPTYQGKDKCKINGTLSVMIRGAEAIGGVWKFRTTSYNSVVGVMSSLALIKRVTGGPLAGIPLVMTLTPKTVQDPIQGSQQTIYVVGVEFRGNIEKLQDTGHQLMLSQSKHNLKIEHIEQEARTLLSYAPQQFAAPDDISDEVDEYYPEAALDSMEKDTPDNSVTVEKQERAPIQKTVQIQRGNLSAADALNQSASVAQQSTAVAHEDDTDDDQDQAATVAKVEPALRVAGRLTYWIDKETGEYADIAKGGEIPATGETVNKAAYMQFCGANDDADQDDTPTEQSAAAVQGNTAVSEEKTDETAESGAIDLF